MHGVQPPPGRLYGLFSVAAVTDEGLTLPKVELNQCNAIKSALTFSTQHSSHHITEKDTNVLSQLIPKYKAHTHNESYQLSVYLCSIRC